MNTLIFLAPIGIVAVLVAVAFKCGQEWERNKPLEPTELATYIPPQTKRAPSIHDQVDLLMEHLEASEGKL